MTLHDGAPERLFWRALRRSATIFGPLRARAMAVLALRVLSRSEHGYTKTIYRVARHTSSASPNVVHLPEAWSSASSLVRVRRLGLSLDLDLRDNLQRIPYYAGTYEPGVIRFIERELRRGDVFMDVGAHIGVHALVAARRLRELGGGRVIAFEPTRDSAAKIRRAAARNRLDVAVVETGLSDAPGTVELRTDPDYGLDDAGVRSQYGSGAVVQQVRLVPFDTWADEIGLSRLDLVKIDVEGARTSRHSGDAAVAQAAPTPRPRRRDEGHDARTSGNGRGGAARAAARPRLCPRREAAALPQSGVSAPPVRPAAVVRGRAVRRCRALAAPCAR